MSGSLFDEHSNDHTELDDDAGGSSDSFKELDKKISKVAKNTKGKTEQNKKEIKKRIWSFLKEQYSPIGARMFTSYIPRKPIEEHNHLSNLTPWMIGRIMNCINEGELNLKDI